MKNKIGYIIIAVVFLLAGFAGGFLFQRKSSGSIAKTAPKAEINEKVNVSVPECSVTDFLLNDKMIDEYAKGEKFGAQYLEKYFEMDEKTAEDFVKNPEEWLCFNVFINAVNNDKLPLYCYNIGCDNNGKKDAYIFTAVSQVSGIDGGKTLNMCVPVLIKNNNLSTDESREYIKCLNLSVAYGDAFEPENAEISYAPVIQ